MPLYSPADENYADSWRRVMSECASLDDKLPPELETEARREKTKWESIQAAMFKLRKSCCNCRWIACERSNKKRRYTHWYCKKVRSRYPYPPTYAGLTCEHFKRKSKSKR